MPKRQYCVYIMASFSGTLYVGFTGDIYSRALQHMRGEGCAFTTEYGCTRLIYYEKFASPLGGIKREKQLKAWSRAKKIGLIASVNPQWTDLAKGWGELLPAPPPQRT